MYLYKYIYIYTLNINVYIYIYHIYILYPSMGNIKLLRCMYFSQWLSSSFLDSNPKFRGVHIGIEKTCH